MKTYWRIETTVTMAGSHCSEPIECHCTYKPTNVGVGNRKKMIYFDYFESREEAEDFAFYHDDKNFDWWKP